MDVSNLDIFNINKFSLIYRPLLKSVLRKLKWSDDMVKGNVTLNERHIKWIKIMKLLVTGFLLFNFCTAAFMHLPARINITSDFCMTPCVGKVSNMFY